MEGLSIELEWASHVSEDAVCGDIGLCDGRFVFCPSFGDARDR